MHSTTFRKDICLYARSAKYLDLEETIRLDGLTKRVHEYAKSHYREALAQRGIVCLEERAKRIYVTLAYFQKYTVKILGHSFKIFPLEKQIVLKTTALTGDKCYLHDFDSLFQFSDQYEKAFLEGCAEGRNTLLEHCFQKIKLSKRETVLVQGLRLAVIRNCPKVVSDLVERFSYAETEIASAIRFAVMNEIRDVVEVLKERFQTIKKIDLGKGLFFEKAAKMGYEEIFAIVFAEKLADAKIFGKALCIAIVEGRENLALDLISYFPFQPEDIEEALELVNKKKNFNILKAITVKFKNISSEEYDKRIFEKALLDMSQIPELHCTNTYEELVELNLQSTLNTDEIRWGILSAIRFKDAEILNNFLSRLTEDHATILAEALLYASYEGEEASVRSLLLYKSHISSHDIGWTFLLAAHRENKEVYQILRELKPLLSQNILPLATFFNDEATVLRCLKTCRVSVSILEEALSEAKDLSILHHLCNAFEIAAPKTHSSGLEETLIGAVLSRKTKLALYIINTKLHLISERYIKATKAMAIVCGLKKIEAALWIRKISSKDFLILFNIFCRYGIIECINEMLEKVDASEMALGLIEAAKYNQLEVVTLLLPMSTPESRKQAYESATEEARALLEKHPA